LKNELMDDRRLLVGRFGAPHGVRGEVRLQSFTGDPGAIARYPELGDASGARRFAIRSLRHIKDNLFVARIEGVADRDGAERLTNVEIYVSRATLPAPAEEEFYLADLIGLAALDESRAPIGRVANVLDFGGGDILEIAPSAGGETLLFPFTKAVVPEIDVAAGWVVVVPPREVSGEAGGAEGEDEVSPQRATSGKT
jgi:16S rRNA processing protein RimM